MKLTKASVAICFGLLGILFPGALRSQLIQTSDPIPAQVQIFLHLDDMMQSWEVEEALKNNPPEIEKEANGKLLSDEQLSQQLKHIQGEMEFDVSPRLKDMISIFTEDKRAHAQALLGLIEAYGPLFQREIESRHLPNSLRYLPAALSACNTLAVGKQGGAGLWQLQYHSALRYGLNCNATHDERRNPELATAAALSYLQDLHQQYKNWTLAILAFTCGPANLNKAHLRLGKVKNFETLYPLLPKYGRDFWTAFVALNYLGKYHRLHNLKPLKINLPKRTNRVRVEHPLGIQALSMGLRLSDKAIQAYNPEYRSTILNQKGNTSHIALPSRYIAPFKSQKKAIYAYQQPDKAASEAEVDPKPDIPVVKKPVKKTPLPPPSANQTLIRYTIQSGDNLGQIAARHGVKISQLQNWNNLNGTMIKAEEQLKIYVSKSQAKKLQQPKPFGKKEGRSNSKGKTYTVKTGDTLWGIAQEFPGISADKIMEHNQINENLQPGQVLIIPVQ